MITRKQAIDRARQFDVIHARLEDLQIEEGAFDCTVTDPPYDNRTQANTRRGRKTNTQIVDVMPLGFDPATDAKRERWAGLIAHVTRRWAVVFSDHEGSMNWADHLARAGMVYVRTAIWLRRGGAPQFTGDRPAIGHECIVLAHNGRGMKWNGGGKAGVYEERVVRGDSRTHPAQKPVSLMLDLVRDFCSPGEAIFDPFVGSGTTLVAAKHLGIGCVGVDDDPKWASYAARRAAAAQINHATED